MYSKIKQLTHFLLLAAGLAAAGTLAGQGAPPNHHGYMHPDLETLQRWSQQRAQAPRALKASPKPGGTVQPPPASFSLLNLVDYVPSERDQGNCGNCWVWASTAMTETALNAQYGIRDRLSTQWISSAKTDAYVCNGGTLTDFCTWYTNAGNNPHPGVLVPWNNPGGAYQEWLPEAMGTSSLVPAAGIGLMPSYTGATLTGAVVPTLGLGQAQAISNIQAALLNNQAVGFSFWADFGSATGFDAFWNNQPEAALWINASEGGTWDYNWGAHMVTIVGYDATDPNPANHYWILLNSWGITTGRPTGLFRMPMQMNYDATYTYSGIPDACYVFETLALSGVNPPGSVPVAVTAPSCPAAPLQVGMPLALASTVTAGSPPLTYAWSLNGTPIPGATNATYTLPYVNAAHQGQSLTLTVANAQGQVNLGPIALNVEGTQMLPDPGFEDGQSTALWSFQGNAFLENYSTWAHSGDWSVKLHSGQFTALTSAPVTLSGPTPIIASYWLLTNLDWPAQSASGTCTVQIVDPSLNVLRTLRTHTSQDTDHYLWAQEAFDVSDLLGKTVSFRVAVSDYYTTFFLDDFSLVSLAQPTAAPYIASFSPALGIAGTQVALKGSGFTGVTAVSLAGHPIPSFSVTDDSDLTLTVPAGSGSGPFKVTSPTGTFTSTGIFTGPSAITSFSPFSAAAGSTVYLTGQNFLGATAVAFNGTAATFTIVNNTTITATVPTGATSGVISVTTPSGTCQSSTSFTVLYAPAITSFSPTSGPAGTVVTLTGTGFTGTYAVYLSSGYYCASNVISDTQLSVTVPGSASTGTFTVYNYVGSGTSSNSFTVTPPTFTSFTPSHGRLGSTVTITGTGLTSVYGVSFNGGFASAYSNTNPTQLSVTVPTGATSGLITLYISSGSSNLTSASSFTVDFPAPTITSFTPASGPVGSTVTVNGTGFLGMTSLTLNGVSTYGSVISDTQVSFTVPSNSTSGLITLTTPGGTATSSTSFTVPAPVITQISPASGNPGTQVTVTGTGLMGLTSLSFNGGTISYPYASADTTVVVTVPCGATTGKISVATPHGNAQSSGSFTVTTQAPLVSSVSPAFGAAYTWVAFLGSGLNCVTDVKFNGTASFGITHQQDTNGSTDTILSCLVPPGATTGPVTLQSQYGTATVASFVVPGPPPTFTGFSPAQGGPGASITLTGTNFTGVQSVAFNGVTASAFTVVNDTTITAKVPAGASTGPITVTSYSGSVTSSSAFTYLNLALSSFSPTLGIPGTKVVISGLGFTGCTSVTFGGVLCTAFSVVNDSQISATVPPLAVNGPLAVATPLGIAQSPGSFTVDPLALTSLVPSNGPVGTSVTITGSGFSGATAVMFNGVPAAGFSVQSDSQIAATVPATATTGPVTVTVPTGAVLTSASPFTVGITVTITTPQPDNLMVGTQRTFTAAITGTSNLGVVWTVNAGSLNGSTSNPVLFTAPITPGKVTLTATSAADATQSASMTFSVGGTDLDGSGSLDVLDLAAFVEAYGTKAGDPGFLPAADLNGDGVIDDNDLILFLSAF